LNNEAEVQKLKEKLRKQFEEQMELSLARVNSEKLNQFMDRDSQLEQSEVGDGKMPDGIRRKFEEEEEEEMGNQYMRASTEMDKEVWMRDKSEFYMNKFVKTKLEENLLENLGPEWEIKGEIVDGSPKKSSAQTTESDHSSPEDKMRKRYENEGFKDEKGSEIANIRAREIQITEEDEEKLGVIREAEEIKEDSFENEVAASKKANLKS